jgi:transcription-repair coupling factor (superfamily II helicase)
LRDLEIRGAGNLLGAEQHGHIDSVGYDLYVKILNEAILNERNIKPELPFESIVDIKDDANIPESYISVSSQRMEMYKKLTLIDCESDHSDILDELCDRFGEPPVPTLRLLDVALARALASKCKISKIIRAEGEIRFVAQGIELDVWSEVFSRVDGMRFPSSAVPYVAYKLKRGEDAACMAKTIMLEYYKSKYPPSAQKESEEKEKENE